MVVERTRCRVVKVHFNPGHIPKEFLRKRPASGKKCVLFVGNGFSIDFVKWAGLRVELACSSLMPPPKHALYLPSPEDRFREGRLWDKEIWPNLHAIWEEHREKFNFLDFCKELADLGPMNAAKEDGKWSFLTCDLGNEFRAYLWHLFKFYDMIMGPVLHSSDLSGWQWYNFLGRLRDRCVTATISLNYDYNFELLSMRHGAPCISPRFNTPMFSWELASKVEFCLKPHGSIACMSVDGLGTAPNPWLNKLLTQNMSTLCFDPTGGIAYPPARCPVVPDLVPPGHCDSHFCEPGFQIRDDCSRAISEADCVIFAGVSGAEPDTPEIRRYCDAIKDRAKVAVVGIRRFGDCQNQLVNCILERRRPITYQFFEASGIWADRLVRFAGC